LHHFEGLRLDPNVQANMARVRSKTRKNGSPVSAALIEIARLLARQAAREWAECGQKVDRPGAPAPLPEQQQ